jgi:hypothetical protein
MAVAYGTLAAVQLGFLGLGVAQAGAPDDEPALSPDALGSEALPARYGTWQRQEFEVVRRERGDPLGEFSLVWRYRSGPLKAVVALDYPFRGWHELPESYRTQGWVLEQRVAHRDGCPDGERDQEVVEAHLSKSSGELGCLFFSIVDGDGNPVAVPPETMPERLATRWTALRPELRGARTRDGGSTYLVQLFVESYVPLTVAEQSQAQVAFPEVRSRLFDRLLDAQRGRP